MEGDSGFVNLMRMKRAYFRSIRPKLMAEIDKRAEKDSSFREELFDKLYTFFHRYFCESGSIYFRHLPAFSKTYERVYADGQDVALSWKTQMLYYVKSDVLVRSMPVELSEEDKPHNTKCFYFDASEFEHKKNNERREFVFAFSEVKQEAARKIVHLKVSYSQKGSRTKTDEILKQSRKAGISLSDEELQKAIRVFRRQTEADFFINKDARGFLREQFDLWVYQYIFQEETIFEEERIRQIQGIKDTAYHIIDFIAQFEDELRRVWEKPKFVRKVNYVVTLDKLTDGVLDKIAEHKGATAQVTEWRKLGVVDNAFSMEAVFNGQKGIADKNGANGKYKFLPLDTKHFKDLELEILDGLGNLDEVLDGELVHSENWQALNTLQNRYKEKVKCIYIDPPFNLDSSDQFDYRTNYKDSCWATMLENRLALARDFLSDDGSIFVRCDYNGNWIIRQLMDRVFGHDNFKNEIIVNRTQEFFKSPTPKQRRLMNDVDSILLSAKSDSTRINRIRVAREEVWHEPFLPARSNKSNYKIRVIGKEKISAPQGRMWGLSQDAIDELYEKDRIKIEDGKVRYWPLWKNLKNNWTDIPGYARTWKFNTENSEPLLERVANSVSSGDDCCVDFFSGSGTTQAVAQKLGRKWLGIEMGEHFHSVVMPRMKKVLSGHQSGISKETKYKGGGCFKYYTLEQYEETLKNARYQDGEQLELDSTKSPFEQYAFFGDDKLAHAVAPLKNGKLKINLQDLYPDIDIAESLANIMGKQIRRRTADEVLFADGSSEKTNPAKMTEKEKRHFVSLIKPYLWWGE